MNKIMTAEDKKLRLPWWAVLCVIFGTIPLGLLFLYFGKLNLALPVLDSAAMIAITIAMRWRLRRHVWFWIAMAVIVALHVLLILYVPWTNKWVPAPAIIPIALVDLYVMLKTVSIVEKFMKGPGAAEDEHLQ